MTAFLALIRKDLLLFRQDRRALLMTLIVPIVLASFFGYMFGGSGDRAPSRIAVALVLQDTGPTAAKIGAALAADSNLAITPLAYDQAEALVREGKQKVAIVVPPGFGDAAGAALFGAGDKPAIGLLYDPSQTAVLAMVKGMLTQHVMQIVSAEMFGGQGGRTLTARALQQVNASGSGDADSQALKDMLASVQKFQDRKPAAEGTAGGLSMPFSTRDQAMTSKALATNYNGYAHSFAGMGVQFILFMGVDIGIGILLARRLGIWNRLLAAPVTLNTVLLARSVSSALIGFFLLMVIFAFAVVVYRVDISNPVGFVMVAAAFACMTASFGLLIAAFGKTPEAARGLAIFVTLLLVMLGGAWVPSFIFPQWMQSLTIVIPTRWAIDGFDAMTWRGLGLDVALQCSLVLLGFTAVFGSVALWKFRSEHA